MKRLFIIFTLFLFIIACQENQLIDNNVTNIRIIDQPNARPVIDRTHEATDMIDKPAPNTGEIIQPEQNVFLNNHRSEIEFLLPINFPFGKAYEIIDKYDFALLKPEAMMTGDGHFRGYEQLLRFDFKENTTGNISFVSENNYFGTALFFPEDSPIFAYELNMELPFYSDRVINSIISILGSDYLVTEANNKSLMLNGLNIERYLNIQDKKELITNNKQIKNTLVHYNGHELGYQVFAEDIDNHGILLKEGESLRGKLSKEFLDHVLLSEFFDIRYQGLEPLEEHVKITLKNYGNYVDIIWETPTHNMRFPILGYNELGELWYGGETNKIHFTKEEMHFNDWAIINAISPNGELTSKLLKFTSIDLDEKMILFRDEAGNKISVDYENNKASLPLLDHNLRINLIDNETIVIDMPKQEAIYLTDILRISLDNIEETLEDGYIMNLTIETTPFRDQRINNIGEISQEEITISLIAENDEIRTKLYEPMFIEPKDEEDSATITSWGSEIYLEMDSNDPQSTSEDVTLLVPIEQRFGIIELGVSE